MHRRIATVSLLAVVIAACGPSAVGEQPSPTSETVATTTSPAEPATSTAEATTTSDPSEATTTSPETTTTSDREVAPDFTLELGDGGSYTLSEGEKPVYLVFWAEW